MENSGLVPRHVAIILDGNGRWAKERGKLVSEGHLAGANNVETITDACIARGIRYLTVYAFSTENWKRSQQEVSYLMGLLKQYLINNKKDCIRKNTRVRIIGDRSVLSDELRDLMLDVEEGTAQCDGFHLTFAISYGGRDEITRAARRIAHDACEGKLSQETIEKFSEEDFEAYLDTAALPDPDLLIRPGGELRISNFLLWQLAYAEFYFTPVYWPDFSEADLDKAIEAFSMRQRRFGGR